MVSEEKPIFLRTVFLVILFIVLEVGVLIFYFIPGGISGFSVVDVSDVYSRLYPSSKIFLIVQWAILTILLIFIYLKNMGIHKRNAEVTDVHLKDALSKSKTPLDALYLVLKDKKKLGVRTISKLFNISPDLAMEWARILEAGELVVVDYPGIGGPVVRIPEEEKEDDDEEKGPIIKKVHPQMISKDKEASTKREGSKIEEKKGVGKGDKVVKKPGKKGSKKKKGAKKKVKKNKISSKNKKK